MKLIELYADPENPRPGWISVCEKQPILKLQKKNGQVIQLKKSIEINGADLETTIL